MRKLNWKKILVRAFWLLAGIGMIVLLGAAMQKKDQKLCADVKVEITGENRHMFIDEKDILDILNASRPVKTTSLSALNLREMESLVEKNPWVLNAEMYLDNNQVLQVRIEERQPVARVFTMQGNSFYLDSGALRLPLSDKLSAKVPVFTGFPSDKDVLARPDSLLLGGMVKLGQYILADSFWMAQVAQVEITPQAGFEIVPVIGDHLIAFGDAANIDKKFRKLYTFYRKAWLQNGINTYEKLDVQYDNQVVAIKKGTAKAMADSFRVMQMQQAIQAIDAALKDSMTNVIDSAAKHKASLPVVKPVAKTNSVVAKNNKTGAKPLSNGTKQKTGNRKQKKTKPPVQKNQPKAVMDKNQK